MGVAAAAAAAASFAAARLAAATERLLAGGCLGAAGAGELRTGGVETEGLAATAGFVSPRARKAL